MGSSLALGSLPSCHFPVNFGEPVTPPQLGPRPAVGLQMTDGSRVLSVRRQASLNQAAEKYYGRAANLRPNVSTATTG